MKAPRLCSFASLTLCIQVQDGHDWRPGPVNIALRPEAIVAVVPTIPPDDDCTMVLFSGGYRIAVAGSVESVREMLLPPVRRE